MLPAGASRWGGEMFIPYPVPPRLENILERFGATSNGLMAQALVWDTPSMNS